MTFFNSEAQKTIINHYNLIIRSTFFSDAEKAIELELLAEKAHSENTNEKSPQDTIYFEQMLLLLNAQALFYRARCFESVDEITKIEAQLKEIKEAHQQFPKSEQLPATPEFKAHYQKIYNHLRDKLFKGTPSMLFFRLTQLLNTQTTDLSKTDAEKMSQFFKQQAENYIDDKHDLDLTSEEKLIILKQAISSAKRANDVFCLRSTSFTIVQRMNRLYLLQLFAEYDCSGNPQSNWKMVQRYTANVVLAIENQLSSVDKLLAYSFLLNAEGKLAIADTEHARKYQANYTACVSEGYANISDPEFKRILKIAENIITADRQSLIASFSTTAEKRKPTLAPLSFNQQNPFTSTGTQSTFKKHCAEQPLSPQSTSTTPAPGLTMRHSP